MSAYKTQDPSKRYGFLAPVLGCIAVLIVAVFVYPPWMRAERTKMRARDLPITVRSAEPIVAAIHQYNRDQGKPPATLNDLIPKYIVTLPNAGPVAEDGWHYRREEAQSGGWALYVAVRDEYSPNLPFGFGDYFVYHPSERYAEAGYGGGLEPFGKWGYYVE